MGAGIALGYAIAVSRSPRADGGGLGPRPRPTARHWPPDGSPPRGLPRPTRPRPSGRYGPRRRRPRPARRPSDRSPMDGCSAARRPSSRSPMGGCSATRPPRSQSPLGGCSATRPPRSQSPLGRVRRGQTIKQPVADGQVQRGLSAERPMASGPQAERPMASGPQAERPAARAEPAERPAARAQETERPAANGRVTKRPAANAHVTREGVPERQARRQAPQRREPVLPPEVVNATWTCELTWSAGLRGAAFHATATAAGERLSIWRSRRSCPAAACCRQPRRRSWSRAARTVAQALVKAGWTPTTKGSVLVRAALRLGARRGAAAARDDRPLGHGAQAPPRRAPRSARTTDCTSASDSSRRPSVTAPTIPRLRAISSAIVSSIVVGGEQVPGGHGVVLADAVAAVLGLVVHRRRPLEVEEGDVGGARRA